MSRVRFVPVVLAIGLLCPLNVDAAKWNKVVNIGDSAPDWKDIPGIDDQKHSLSDYKDAKLIVQIFTCNNCPVAVAYQDRIKQLQQDYQDQGVQVVAINVNNVEGDRLPEMKERAESERFNYPYLHDASQKSARGFGATVTPHVFVLDQDRKIAYMGAVDDEMDPDMVTATYLRDAIDFLLAGKQPKIKETQQLGCGVKYE